MERVYGSKSNRTDWRSAGRREEPEGDLRDHDQTVCSTREKKKKKNQEDQLH